MMPVKEMYFLIKTFLTKETSEPRSFQHILLSIYEEMLPHQELFRKRGLDSYHPPLNLPIGLRRIRWTFDYKLNQMRR